MQTAASAYRDDKR